MPTLRHAWMSICPSRGFAGFAALLLQQIQRSPRWRSSFVCMGGRGMSRRSKWILWIAIIAAFVAYKVLVSPTDAELYERLNEQRLEDPPHKP